MTRRDVEYSYTLRCRFCGHRFESDFITRYCAQCWWWNRYIDCTMRWLDQWKRYRMVDALRTLLSHLRWD